MYKKIPTVKTIHHANKDKNKKPNSKPFKFYFMKQYAILSKTDHSPVIVSTNSHDFAEMMQLGYEIVYSGNKKQCESVLNENEMELSY